MGMTEYEDEPVEGLPEYLPEGETMVWQGRPTAAAPVLAQLIRALCGLSKESPTEEEQAALRLFEKSPPPLPSLTFAGLSCPVCGQEEIGRAHV